MPREIIVFIEILHKSKHNIFKVLFLKYLDQKKEIVGVGCLKSQIFSTIDKIITSSTILQI